MLTETDKRPQKDAIRFPAQLNQYFLDDLGRLYKRISAITTDPFAFAKVDEELAKWHSTDIYNRDIEIHLTVERVADDNSAKSVKFEFRRTGFNETNNLTLTWDSKNIHSGIFIARPKEVMLWFKTSCKALKDGVNPGQIVLAAEEAMQENESGLAKVLLGEPSEEYANKLFKIC
jgi:hypothetical protein